MLISEEKKQILQSLIAVQFAFKFNLRILAIVQSKSFTCFYCCCRWLLLKINKQTFIACRHQNETNFKVFLFILQNLNNSVSKLQFCVERVLLEISI